MFKETNTTTISDIDAVATNRPEHCPHCQSNNLVGFGRREQMVKDLPMHSKRVGLYVETKRFQCRTCTKTFYESISPGGQIETPQGALSSTFGEIHLVNFGVSISTLVSMIENGEI